MQFTRGAEIAKNAYYREIPASEPNSREGDGPYSNPVFHEILRACFKAKRGKFTAYDVALADTFTWCHLQGIHLKKYKGLESTFARAADLAMANFGAHDGLMLPD